MRSLALQGRVDALNQTRTPACREILGDATGELHDGKGGRVAEAGEDGGHPVSGYRMPQQHADDGWGGKKYSYPDGTCRQPFPACHRTRIPCSARRHNPDFFSVFPTNPATARHAG